MRKRKRIFCFFLVCCMLCACSGQTQEKESGYQIWYMNQEETRLEFEYRELQAKNLEGRLKETLEVLREAPTDEKYKPVLPDSVSILEYSQSGNQLILNFSEEYLNMPKIYEVLVRAAFVRTLCQLPEVEMVEFCVGGEPLLDLNGTEIGFMKTEQFIENAGEEINAYKDVTLKLYYANESGDKLVSQSMVIEYNSNLSLEKLIVERLIEGPPFEGAYPTIPSTTKLLSATVKDRTCYVNLDAGFLETVYNVTENVPVYSIVNSLIENTNITKVQISINGETNLMFRGSISFDTIFEKNEDLIE